MDEGAARRHVAAVTPAIGDGSVYNIITINFINIVFIASLTFKLHLYKSPTPFPSTAFVVDSEPRL